MAQRIEPADSLDDFPTPPWAARALFEHVIPDDMANKTCWEPACGRGHMSRVLERQFGGTKSTDIHPYGYGSVHDFTLTGLMKIDGLSWLVTNPPFKLAETFAAIGIAVAQQGVALLVRTVFLESVGRYERLFSKTPPAIVAQFVERVPMVKGRLDGNASTATSYAWLVWRKGWTDGTRLIWIPPCRKALTRDGDYPDNGRLL